MVVLKVFAECFNPEKAQIIPNFGFLNWYIVCGVLYSTKLDKKTAKQSFSGSVFPKRKLLMRVPNRSLTIFALSSNNLILKFEMIFLNRPNLMSNLTYANSLSNF